MNYKLILIGCIIIVIMAIIGNYWKKNNDDDLTIESFQSLSVKEHYEDIYDNFYSSIYNELFNSQLKNEFEIHNIKQYAIDKYKDKKNIHILDAGCGTGNHIKILTKNKFKCTGLDKSMTMLQKAQKLNPGSNLVKGDFHNKSTFKRREFSHITALFYTIYYSDNPEKVFKNFNYWLKPKGYLCLHLVHPDKFDPVLEKSSSLIPLFSPQKHAKSRKTETSLQFNNFKYISNWKFNQNDVQFVEQFLFKNKPVARKNIHKFTMNKVSFYIKLLQNNGFKLTKIIDLRPANHEFNAIYVFKKIYGS